MSNIINFCFDVNNTVMYISQINVSMRSYQKMQKRAHTSEMCDIKCLPQLHFEKVKDQ